jgi:multicomponent Na+:H+ antiporter subunit F
MPEWYLVGALVLLVNIIVGGLRVLRGPTPADRMLASQLFGTTGVALLLLLAHGSGQPAFRDVALVLALLGIVATVAFVQQAGASLRDREGGSDR